MKGLMKILRFLLCCLIFGATQIVSAQKVWSSSHGTVTFTKAGFADWTLNANQDHISDSVWITRASNQSLFNIRKENAYVTNSPVGTQWAFGTVDSFSLLSYKPFSTLSSNDPQSLIGKNLVLHLTAENIYLDIKFLAFGNGSSGGTFSYVRAATVLGVFSERSIVPSSFELKQNYPNPFNPATTIEFSVAADAMTTVKIYNALGQEVSVLVNEQLNAGMVYRTIFNGQNLASDIYVVRLQSGNNVQIRKMMLLK